MMLFVGIAAAVVGFVGGYYTYSKIGAKVQAIGTTISADLKK